MFQLIPCLSLAGALILPSQEPTVAEWGKRLAGPEVAEARDSLAALGRRAGPILAELMATAEPRVAYQCVTLFHVIARNARGVVPPLARVLLDEEASTERRALAALALGAIADKSCVRPLSELIEERVEPEISVAARVALGNIGGPAASPMVKLLESHDLIVQQWAAQVLAVLGPDAAPTARTLGALLEEDRAYYAYPTIKLTLERMGKPGQKVLDRVWESRAKTLRNWSGSWVMPIKVYESNETLMDDLRNKRVPGMANEDVPTERIPPTAEMALPAHFTDFNGDGGAAVTEVLAVWARHLAIEIDGLTDALYSGDPPTALAAWRSRVLPVEASSLGMETLAPKPEGK